MNRTAPARFNIAAVAIAIAIAVAGFAWEWVRFGSSPSDTATRLERQVRQIVDARANQVELLARQVAAEGQLIAQATESRDRLPALFDRLQSLSAPVGQQGVAVSLYVPIGSTGSYRILAWSDGPGEQNLSPERLSGPSALFVAPGHAGLRLLYVAPVTESGRPIAVAVAETVLAPVDRTTRRADRRLDTPYGSVAVIARYASARDEIRPENGFAIASASGTPLLEVRYEPSDLVQRRSAFRHRTYAAALLPLVVALAGWTGPIIGRRRRAPTGGRWLVLSTVLAGAVVLIVAAIAALSRLAGVPDIAIWTVGLTGVVGVIAVLPGAFWWRAMARRSWTAAPVRFVVEHTVAGLVLAATLEFVARLLDRWLAPGILERGHFVLFPFSAENVLSLGNLLLSEIAVGWTAACALGVAAVRWRLVPSSSATIAAALLWATPSAVLLTQARSYAALARPASFLVVAAAISFALFAVWLRRYYRHTTQSMRLLLAFLSLLLPLFAFYPMSSITTERATRRVIAEEYAPATAGHPLELRSQLRLAQDRIDQMTGLAELAAGSACTDSQAAFVVWSQTGLQRSRVISDVELYGADRAPASRFAFNLPEYLNRTCAQTWQGASCEWKVFGEVTPFGAEERRMLHAERGICDASGALQGGIVVHVASNDYQALPFVSSPSPYYDVLGLSDNQPQTQRLPDLRLAVYGWSARPLFASGRVAWPIDQATFDRLYQDGAPFWTSVEADGLSYEVHFSQNRAGIYALGYPNPTWLEHATRLAEIAALTAVFFVALQLGAVLLGPVLRDRTPALHVLFREVRTSFYRKLFLFFVAVAVVPVLVAALAFGGYMTSRFRADVESEASSTVTVARRVFQELQAGGERPGADLTPPTDDVMVWIRQVIGQDVNLFEGSELIATSQRDLFDSGLLPTRTPASVYRSIALERRPTLVAEDRVGAFQYIVAAAPVPERGRDAVLTVPLAPRQREIERELDTFNRRVLVGAVLVLLFAAGLGASLASRIADPVARLTRATRQIAAGRLDVRIAADTADELRRLVDDFNSMAAMLVAQRDELARANQLKAWNEMARQVAHEIKNPLTPLQLAAEHLQSVHEDRGRPLGPVLDQCLVTILSQVRLLRRIASEFANFASSPVPRPSAVDPAELVTSVVNPYRTGLAGKVEFEIDVPPDSPAVWGDRTLLARALTNLVENAVQAMPSGGRLVVHSRRVGTRLTIDVKDTGVGMEPAALTHAFEPYFSTKTAGSGLGLANARRNIEREGGTIEIASEPGTGTTVTVTLPLAEDLRDDSADGPSPSR